MKLFGKHSQNTDSLKAAKDEIELVESVNEEVYDDKESEQAYTCSDCDVTIPLSKIKKNLYVCPNCGKHAKISARRNVMWVGRWRIMIRPTSFTVMKRWRRMIRLSL